MRKLRAFVRTSTGATKHAVATADGLTTCPVPSYVIIEEQEGAYVLLRYGEDDDCVADTWHVSVEEAKAQAAFEYGIEESDWTTVADS